MQHLPQELVEASGQSNGEKTKWLAICPRGKGDSYAPRYTWELDANRSFGENDFRQWVLTCVRARGYPVRVQWRKKTDGALLAEGTIWDAGASEYSEDEEHPTLADALIPAQGDMYVGREDGASSAMERLLLMLLEQPETVRNGLSAISEFINSLATPDEKVMQRQADYAAAVAGKHAADAVERKLAEMMLDAGFDIEPDGTVTSPDDEETDLDVEDEQVVEVEEVQAAKTKVTELKVVGETDEDETQGDLETVAGVNS